LYAIIKAAGRDISFEDLLKREYVDSWKGSSLPALKKAAQDNGLYAEIVENLTTRDLRACPYPLILHVKTDASSKEYNHYELFLGTGKGLLRLYDPPKAIAFVRRAELAPRWDGIALIVSPSRIDTAIILGSARKRFMFHALLVGAIVLLLLWGRQRWLPAWDTLSRIRRCLLAAAQGVGLLLVATLTGMIFHFANEEGFLAHPNATAGIEQAHRASFIPKVNADEVGRGLRTGAIIVDARLHRDYEAGHIEGAISIPVTATDDELRKAVDGIRKTTPIVVYCQSAGCSFGEKVAVALSTEGFSSVFIFKGGWLEWELTTRR